MSAATTSAIEIEQLQQQVAKLKQQLLTAEELADHYREEQQHAARAAAEFNTIVTAEPQYALQENSTPQSLAYSSASGSLEVSLREIDESSLQGIGWSRQAAYSLQSWLCS